ALQPLRRGERWPALFGRQGLVQYQFVVPTASVEVIGVALDLLAEHRTPPALAVLKRLGPADPGPLTFAMEGWTLAVDLPARWPGLELALGDLDEVVAAAGGRVYLAKDSRLPAESLALMYPRLGEWQQARAVMDPRGVFGSDLSRRLRLAPQQVAS
ncbi:MAG: D-arabinono-1,4-lactone oxidase, partial [Ornithinibacter sp.]